MMKDTSYSKIPSNYGLCAADCPRGRHLSQADRIRSYSGKCCFSSDIALKAIEAMAGKCKYYRSNEKVRYAKGFLCTAGALAVSVSGTFRCRLIGSWGVRRYYQKRKGETLLSPAEQQQVVALARKLGVRLDEYFDGYVEEYDW